MNGILKTQAEYYNDPVTYTGEGGTETNKAVIEDIFDLCAWHNILTTQPETYAITSHKQYAVMVNDVNFNNHPTMKFGITDDTLLDMTFNSQYGELDGQGHTIFNMVVNSNTPTSSTNGIISRGTIINTNFKNMVVVTSRTTNYRVIRRMTFINCNFSVYLSVREFGIFVDNASDTNKVTISDCTFNFTGTVSSNNILSINQVVRTRFNFSNLVVISTSGNVLVSGGTFSQCAFTGLIYQKDFTSVTRLVNSNFVTDSYFAIITGITTYTGLFPNNYPTSGMNMIDIDLLGGEYADGAHYMCVHTLDLKNKDFLQRNGFITL